MEKNGWKITAIIFIILFVLETICIIGFLKWALDYVDEDYERESNCAWNVCSEAQAYIYYEYEQVCECYVNNELVKQEYLE